MGPFDRANVRRSREAFVPCSSVAVTRTLVTSRRLLKFADAGAPAHTRASVSDSSGVSYFLWYVAWSPTTTTTGTPARLALCRLASPLPKPGAEVQQHRRGLLGDAGVAVGRAGRRALEQRQHSAQTGHRIQGRHKVHLRGAGVREAHVDPTAYQGAYERVGSVHHNNLGSVVFALIRRGPLSRE